MNIAFFLHPKADVAYLYDDFTIRQALEKMSHHSYSAIPVLSRDGKYVGTISEGDLLWYIVRGENKERQEENVHASTLLQVNIEDLERVRISELDISPARNPAVLITDSIEELLLRAMNQNFIPVTDDRGQFNGIVTRRDVIKHFYEATLFAKDEEFELSK